MCESKTCLLETESKHDYNSDVCSNLSCSIQESHPHSDCTAIGSTRGNWEGESSLIWFYKQIETLYLYL